MTSRTALPEGLTVLRVPSRLEVHVSRAADPKTVSGARWDTEIHGYVLDVENGEPTRVRTRSSDAEAPTKEHALWLLMTWFEHEMREQLGMDPHSRAVTEQPTGGG